MKWTIFILRSSKNQYLTFLDFISGWTLHQFKCLSINRQKAQKGLQQCDKYIFFCLHRQLLLKAAVISTNYQRV